eukprot:4389272-Karenia_brevis.AAC.1
MLVQGMEGSDRWPPARHKELETFLAHGHSLQSHRKKYVFVRPAHIDSKQRAAVRKRLAPLVGSDEAVRIEE